MNTDYKYIEQLLERYWQCETSLQEEDELRSFFAGEVPVHLLPFKELFVYQLEQQQIRISDDFEERMLSQISETRVVKAKRITFVSRLTPLFKAVAMVALVLTFGNVLQQYFFYNNKSDYNYDAYTDTYDDPEVAYKKVSSALMMLSEGMNKSKEQYLADSLKLNVDADLINE